MDPSTTVSALIGGWFEPIADAVAASRLVLACSDDLLSELCDVLSRPWISRLISPGDSERVRELHLHAAVFVDPAREINVCRDPSDNYLLALAEASHADYLVTRDADLLVLKQHLSTEIIYPAQFLQLLTDRASGG